MTTYDRSWTPSDDTAVLGHPRGLGWLSFTEVWERFSYYGMQALLVLYMTHRLLLPGHVEHVLGFGGFRAAIEAIYGRLSAQALGSAIFGLYAGFVWMTPILGGLLADRVTGRTRTIVAGALLMALGHFLMAFEQSFLIALLCLLIGVGCFKGNLASQVSSLYAPGDPRAASAFQIYYLGINLAVIVTPLVCGTLGEVYGWHWGFGAAGIGMVVGLFLYLYARRWLPPEPPIRRAAGHPRTVLAPAEVTRVAILVALLPVLAVAQISANQIANAYVIWAEGSLRLSLFGHAIPVTWLQSLDAFAVVSMIPLSLVFWRWWAKRRPEPDEMTKITIGAWIMVLAPLVLAAASWNVAATGHRVGLGWAVVFEVFTNLGWVNVAPVCLSLYARSAPKPIAATIVGVFYLQLFMSNMLVGWLGGFLDRMSGANFWMLHAALTAGAALILLAVRRPVGRALAPNSSPNSAAGQ